MCQFSLFDDESFFFRIEIRRRLQENAEKKTLLKFFQMTCCKGVNIIEVCCRSKLPEWLN
jgi:hypothetical protein